MKKNLLLFFLIPFISFSQHTIEGVMTSTIKTDWVILYKVEGAKQKYIQDTKIVIDTITVNNNKHAIGTFNFSLPENTKIGFYRALYSIEDSGFVDFIFTKDNISFAFNPLYPFQSVVFSTSKENILYQKAVTTISNAQKKVDSLQVIAIQKPEVNQKANYKEALKSLLNMQNTFLQDSKGKFVHPFIKANLRLNSPEIIPNLAAYRSFLESSFLQNINFSDERLKMSPVLTNKIIDFIFYLNYSEDKKIFEIRQKKAIDTVLAKITDNTFKKEIIELLITQFESNKNVELVDYLLENYYILLPETLKDASFVTTVISNLVAEVGRPAPNFSWKEGTKNHTLSALNDAEYYVLVFWSTSCSHCVKEVPLAHTFFKDKNNVKIIGFALENEPTEWMRFIENIQGWHHVIGLEKWENKTARTYNINATPSYFILNSDKKIIAKPEKLEDLEQFFSEK